MKSPSASGKGRGPQLFLVGKIWHFRYTRNGKRTQRTTGNWSRLHAEAIAWAEYTAEITIPTLAELVAKWVETHEMTVSAGHLRAVEVFGRHHISRLAEIRVDRISTADVEDARNRYLVGHAKASANTWLGHLKLLCNWAVARGLLDRIPWRVGAIRTQKKVRVLLPMKKAAEWLRHVDLIAGKRWGLAAAIRMAAGAGLRESEALGAHWEWIDWDRKTYCPGKTKGKEADPVSVPDWLLKFLEPRRADLGLISRSPRGAGPYSKGSTRQVILQANEVCGTLGVTIHRLRGSYATELSARGVPVQEIQKALRHKSAVTTMAYLEVDMGRVREAQEEIARLMGFPYIKNGERFPGRKIGEGEPGDVHE